jgi:cytochrome c nitrite reductase small subunit
VGLLAYVLYASRAASYFSDNPSACVNCHIMAPYYASWAHSAHSRDTSCNDCHVPQNNALSTYYFKAKDGLYHAAVFTMGAEPQVIRAKEGSAAVVQENCIRCHEQLNAEFVNTDVSYADVKHGKGKVCWNCHREVPHGIKNGLSSAPNAIVPYPGTNVSEWIIEREENLSTGKNINQEKNNSVKK